MRESAIVIHCDLCLYRIDNNANIFQINDKDVCKFCAAIVERAHIFNLTTQILEIVKEDETLRFAHRQD
jgi:hypothetical protein